MGLSNLYRSAFACGLILVASVASATVTPVAGTSWTLALLPDTQHYEGDYDGTFDAQTQFLVDNRDALNLAYVLHEGDITNNNRTDQWDIASAAMGRLDTAGISYSMAAGNHDITYSTRASLMGNYFPISRLDDQPTYGGAYTAEPTSPQNTYSLFNAGGTDWLVLALEYGPRDGVLAWAEGLMNQYSGDVPGYSRREVMIVTHANLYCDSTLYDHTTTDPSTGTQNWSPYSVTMAGGCNDGAEMWEAFKDCDNLKFVFNGHVLEDGAGYLATVGTNGNVVHHMVANYQFLPNGGDGYLRLMEFKDDGTIHVRTYSPTVVAGGTYVDRPDQDFVISLNSPPPVNRHAVAANLVVEGETAPSENTVGPISVPQSSLPQVGTTWQVNRGDYELTIGNQDITYNKGVLLATVSQDLRDGYRATVEVGRNSFGDRQMALSIMGAASATEMNFNTSVAWFGFDAGWTAAHVNADGSIAAGNGVEQSMITKNDTGRFAVDLDVDPQSDGLLFVIGNNNSNRVVQTGVVSTGGGDGYWDVRVQTNGANFSATGTDSDWSLVYLPIDTPNLIGGLYNGRDAQNVFSTDTSDYTMTRIGTGEYQLTIDGETPETGMLLLSVAYEATASGVTAPDDNILNYESDGNGNFIIRSFDLSAVNLQNTHFAWAFVDFDYPIRTAWLPGDANGDNWVDQYDARILAQYWLTQTEAEWWMGDFNGDGAVNDLDASILAAHWNPPSESTSVPEPSTFCLLAIGLGMAFLGRRRLCDR
ncbi:MAG: PEP-CTERM sorting domain-containing protein [Pirellulales bacterium]|nr:PEP-CTERM sorting domain-containing protein [Pirellulales bacterium]